MEKIKIIEYSEFGVLQGTIAVDAHNADIDTGCNELENGVVVVWEVIESDSDKLGDYPNKSLAEVKQILKGDEMDVDKILEKYKGVVVAVLIDDDTPRDESQVNLIESTFKGDTVEALNEWAKEELGEVRGGRIVAEIKDSFLDELSNDEYCALEKHLNEINLSKLQNC